MIQTWILTRSEADYYNFRGYLPFALIVTFGVKNHLIVARIHVAPSRRWYVTSVW